MIEIVALWALPWLLSAFTIYIAWQAGSKRKHAWVVGLVAQAVWFYWIVATANYGLLPGNLVLALVYGRNFFAWSRA